MEEVFVPIANYEGIYEISNLGRVKSLARLSASGASLAPKILKTSANGAGYLSVSLYKGEGKWTTRVHCLVAAAFVENKNPAKFNIINHLDGNKLNPASANLEWNDHSGNSLHSYASGLSSNQGITHRSNKLTEDDVRYIRSQKGLVHIDELTSKFNVHRQTIYGIWQGKYWKSLK